MSLRQAGGKPQSDSGKKGRRPAGDARGGGRPRPPGTETRYGGPSTGRPAPAGGVPVSGRPLPWTREGRLFPAPGPEAASLLVEYGMVLRQVLPLRASHARDLPSAIQSLSASLTSARGAGPKPGYLSDPRMLAAYAWYFLPWNLYRLIRLVRGLALDLPDGSVVVDAGAGPLTFAQALWIAAPHLRSRPLTFVCLDRSRAALALGRELFLTLAGEQGPWRVETVREELPRLPRGGADLLVAANVLNELAARRSASLSEKAARLAESLAGGLAPGGRLLVVEPGVRASGKLLARLRASLVDEEGLALLAPCPHPGPCPLAARGSGTWCHFTGDAVGVPDWLEALSRRSGLPKRDVSLSFLFAGGPAGSVDPALGRVVSNPFPAPGLEGAFARYACAAARAEAVRDPGPRRPCARRPGPDGQAGASRAGQEIRGRCVYPGRRAGNGPPARGGCFENGFRRIRPQKSRQGRRGKDQGTDPPQQGPQP